MEITGSPLIRADPNRFSASSSVFPGESTGAGRPVAMTEIRSTILPLPLPAVGAVIAWSGADP
jgi:hypothetical protein